MLKHTLRLLISKARNCLLQTSFPYVLLQMYQYSHNTRSYRKEPSRSCRRRIHESGACHAGVRALQHDANSRASHSTAAAVSPASLALPGQVDLRMQSSRHSSHTMHSAQHAIDQRVIEKLNVTHVINASNRIDNHHITTGSFVGTSFGCSRKLIREFRGRVFSYFSG